MKFTRCEAIVSRAPQSTGSEPKKEEQEGKLTTECEINRSIKALGNFAGAGMWAKRISSGKRSR